MLLLTCWMRLALTLIWTAGCWSQKPVITLQNFENGCPRHGIDKVRVEGRVYVNGTNIPINDNALQVVVYSAGRNDPYSWKRMDACPEGKDEELSCTNHTSYFDVVYEKEAIKRHSEQSVKIVMREQQYSAITAESQPVTYPVVKESIKEVFKVNDTMIMPLYNDTVIDNITGLIAVSYNVSGVSLAKLSAIQILDSSYKVMAQSSSSFEVSTDIQVDQTTAIYVSYNTTNGCFSGSTGHIKVEFIISMPSDPCLNPDEGSCCKRCFPLVVAGVVAGIIVVCGAVAATAYRKKRQATQY